MADERENSLASAMGLLREALLDSRIGWVLRLSFRPNETVLPLSAEDIISRYSGDLPSNPHIPDNFLEIFTRLPDVCMKHMLQMLEWKDIYKLQLVSKSFKDFVVQSHRNNYPINHLVQGSVDLLGTESVRIRRYRNDQLIINHDQFAKSLQRIRMDRFMIRQKGSLRAASFHIAELRCHKLELRIVDPIGPEEEAELIQVFEEIIVNPHITHLNIIARKQDNIGQMRDSLVRIAERSPTLNPNETHISIIPPN